MKNEYEVKLTKKDEEVKEYNIIFYMIIAPRLDAWEKKYPGKKPPLAADKDGKLYWVNRKNRRQQMKGRKWTK